MDVASRLEKERDCITLVLTTLGLQAMWKYGKALYYQTPMQWGIYFNRVFAFPFYQHFFLHLYFIFY